MRVLALLAATALSSSAIADSCVVRKGSMIVNSCLDCREVILREVRPKAEQGLGIFTGEPQSVRVEGGSRVQLPAGERLAIADLKVCQ
jgi:hypothetical protein